MHTYFWTLMYSWCGMNVLITQVMYPWFLPHFWWLIVQAHSDSNDYVHWVSSYYFHVQSVLIFPLILAVIISMRLFNEASSLLLLSLLVILAWIASVSTWFAFVLYFLSAIQFTISRLAHLPLPCHSLRSVQYTTFYSCSSLFDGRVEWACFSSSDFQQ